MNAVIWPSLFAIASVAWIPQAQAAGAGGVDGSWRGDSICLVRPSPCHDEKADYRFAPVPDQPGVKTLTAGKIVDGKVVVMGTAQCTHDSAQSKISCEFPNGVLRFKVDGTAMTMTGTLILPDKTVYRRITLKKVDPS